MVDMDGINVDVVHVVMKWLSCHPCHMDEMDGPVVHDHMWWPHVVKWLICFLALADLANAWMAEYTHTLACFTCLLLKRIRGCNLLQHFVVHFAVIIAS